RFAMRTSDDRLIPLLTNLKPSFSLRFQRGSGMDPPRLPPERTEARTAVAAALRYIRDRKNKMRYASHYAANLPIGSGATEGACWQMQGRVKRPGQTWGVVRAGEPTRTPGLNGIMTTRGLVLSDRWDDAWPAYAAKHQKELPLAA
ncbi:MAG: hypothetical protein KF729_38425, partial [Sandaracinaceae bacterium]|nr:hypothetical protein [Sandaracinaceae bacterium]